MWVTSEWKEGMLILLLSLSFDGCWGNSSYHGDPVTRGHYSTDPNLDEFFAPKMLHSQENLCEAMCTFVQKIYVKKFFQMFRELCNFVFISNCQ